MRVDYGRGGLDLPETSPEQGKASRAGRNSAAASGSANGASADQTRLTFNQAKVQSLQAQVLAQPEIREAKVRALRQSVNDGQYSVSAGEVAGAIVGESGDGQS